MAWSYSNWITFTGQARLDKLRLFIQEIQDAITVGVGADGETINPGSLNPLMAQLMEAEQNLASQLVGGIFAVPTRRRVY